MISRDRRQSGRLMLISPERVFYAGLLGRPRKRTSGGYNIYTAIDEHLTVTQGGSERSRSFRPTFPTTSNANIPPSFVSSSSRKRSSPRLWRN